MYTCFLYKNRGYNLNNIPYKPSVLGNYDLSLPPLDILQGRGLSQITCKLSTTSYSGQSTPLTYGDVVNTDYIALTESGTGGGAFPMGENSGDTRTTYYIVTGDPVMISYDTVVFPVQEDYINSLGGFDALPFVDGIISRATVTEAADEFGAWTEDDNLLGCNDPLEVYGQWVPFQSASAGYLPLVLMETTIDLDKMGALNPPSTKFTDSATGAEVDVPVAKSIDIETDKTDYYLTYVQSESGGSIVRMTEQVTNPNGTALWYLNTASAAVRERLERGIQNTRAIAADTAIISEYEIPQEFAQPVVDVTGKVTRLTTDDKIANVVAVTETKLSFLDANGMVAAHFKRILYGKYRAYGLMSCAGESTEQLPEIIYGTGEGGSPKVKATADPRPNGSPYYNFNSIHGNTTIEEFWKTAIKGLPWRDVPLMYTGAKGSALMAAKYRAAIYAANRADEMQDAMFVERTKQQYGTMATYRRLTGGIISGLSSQLDGSENGTQGGLFRGAMQMYNNAIDNSNNLYNAMRSEAAQEVNFKNARAQEMLNYNISQYAVAPEVQFPSDSEFMRDLYGNKVYMYRYTPSQRDMERQNKILDLYGYKMTQPVVGSTGVMAFHYNQWSSRKNCFIEIKGAQIGAPNTPSNNVASLSERIGLAAQLSAGVRLWKDKATPANI